jgi:RNA polymerase sigma-70 factor, ECF subfamily
VTDDTCSPIILPRELFARYADLPVPIFRNDPALLRRFRSGERAALAAVYDAYVEKVGRLVRRGCAIRRSTASAGAVHVGPDDYLDMIQEVFAKAFSAAGRQGYDGLRDYEPYLLMITRNVMIDCVRRSTGVMPVAPEMFADIASDEAALDDRAPWESARTLAVVRRYLIQLPPELALVHRYRYLDGLSQEATALAMQMSRQNLRTLEARLRSGLEQALAAQAAPPASERAKSA